MNTEIESRSARTTWILFALGAAFGGLLVALLLMSAESAPVSPSVRDVGASEAPITTAVAPLAEESDVRGDAGAAPEAEAPEPPAPEPSVEAPAARPAGSTADVAEEDASGEPFLTVVDSATALGVERRLPVERGVTFPHTIDRVWAWVQVRNRTEPSHIVMVWKREGVEVWRATLEIGLSRGWRTNSRRRMSERDVGSWTVEILDAQDRHLHTLAFEVVEPSPSVGASL